MHVLKAPWESSSKRDSNFRHSTDKQKDVLVIRIGRLMEPSWHSVGMLYIEINHNLSFYQSYLTIRGSLAAGTKRSL
jgi:hypothetical protein